MHVPVVFVHGFIGHLRIPELMHGLGARSVLAPDLLGYGQHRDVDVGQLTIQHQTDHLAGIIDGWCGQRPVLLVAHSGGAAVAVRYARQHAARVAALVSAEGNLAPSDAFLSSRIAAMPLDAVETWLDAARANPTLLLDKERRRFMPDQVDRLSEWLDYQPASTVHAAARALLMETVRSAYADEVASVMKQTPTYLIRGETTPAGLGAPLRFEKLAAGTFVVPGAGHAMVLEAPQIVAMHLRQVLERLDGIGEAA